MSIIDVVNLTNTVCQLVCNVYARVKFPRLFRCETISHQINFDLILLCFFLAFRSIFT